MFDWFLNTSILLTLMFRMSFLIGVLQIWPSVTGTQCLQILIICGKKRNKILDLVSLGVMSLWFLQ